MTFTVIVPFFDIHEQPTRLAAWEQCEAHWARSGVEPFVVHGTSRSAARNNAVQHVPGDVLFFADADTVVPVDQLEMAGELARDNDSFVIAYRTLHMLMRGTRLTPQLLVNPRVGYRREDTSNGVIAVSRNLWNELGGFDERFTVWGGEDRAFMYAALTLRDQDKPLRAPGYGIHLWHRPDVQTRRPSQAYRDGIRLAVRYKQAGGREAREGPLARLPGAQRDRLAMEALLREPGGPRAVPPGTH